MTAHRDALFWRGLHSTPPMNSSPAIPPCGDGAPGALSFHPGAPSLSVCGEALETALGALGYAALVALGLIGISLLGN